MPQPKNLTTNVEKFMKMKKPSEKTISVISKIIDYCSNAYYDEEEDSPLTDEEFDKLVQHYNKFAPEKPSVDSTSNKRNKNLIDTQHMFPSLVGTLDKTNYVYIKDKEEDNNPDADTVEEWFNRTMNSGIIPSNKVLSCYVSWKLDGNSITIAYNDKREVIMALTRGKNGMGADKTSYFKNRKLPKCVPLEKGDIVAIKYEAITTFDNKTKMEEILGKEYASPCSLVSGMLSKDDVPQEVIDKITLAPIRVAYKEKSLTRKEELEIIKDIHLNNSDEFPILINPIIKDNKIAKSKLSTSTITGDYETIIDKIYDIYEDYVENFRDKLKYPVDGIVIEIIQDDVREKLGRREDRNNFEFALKFPYDTKKSVVEDIEFYVSTNGTGRITPVVRFKPIKFSRAVCDHVSISNYKRFKELKLAVGDPVKISYRNDVLAYLNFVDEEHVGDPIKFIGKCPMCKQKLKLNKEKTFVHCINPDCPAIRIGKFNNYLIKIGVDNVRENILTDLYNEGLLTDIASLYELKAKDIMKIEGYQETSANNIITNINAKKELFDYEVLGSLGYKNIGRSTCKEICKKFTIKELKDILEDDLGDMTLELIQIDGVAEITAKQFEEDFSASLPDIERLSKYIKIKEYKNNIVVSDHPEAIVFTGFRNADIQKKLEAAGHSIKSGVSKKVTMVVNAEKGSGTVKEKKAIELGIPVYSVEEFMNDILPKLIG